MQRQAGSRRTDVLSRNAALLAEAEIMPSGVPLSHISLRFFEALITFNCGRQCVHCCDKSSPTGDRDEAERSGGVPEEGFMTLKNWRELFVQLASVGCTGIQISGGDPLLSPFWFDLLVLTKLLGFRSVEFFSTGSRAPHRRALRFMRDQGIIYATSFYSTDSKVHCAITKRNDWAETLQTIRTVTRSGVRIRVGYIELPQNSGHFQKTRAFLHQNGVPLEAISKDEERHVGRSAIAPGVDAKELCGACADGMCAVGPLGALSLCMLSTEKRLGNVKLSGVESVLFGQDFIAERRRVFEMTVAARTRTAIACALRGESLDGGDAPFIQLVSASTPAQARSTPAMARESTPAMARQSTPAQARSTPARARLNGTTATEGRYLWPYVEVVPAYAPVAWA